MKRSASLREAIRQTKPFESLQVEALLTLSWAGDRLLDAVHVPLREEDLTMPQYNVLRILRGTPGGLQTHEVCDRMVARAPNLTRLVDRLEAKGLLRRQRSSRDRRVITLRITEAGSALVERVTLPLVRAVNHAMRTLSTPELRELVRMLNLLGSSAQEPFPVEEEASS